MTFKLEKAPTAKTLCDVCSQRIELGDVRCVANFHGFKYPKKLYYHPRCLIDYIETRMNFLVSGD